MMSIFGRETTKDAPVTGAAAVMDAPARHPKAPAKLTPRIDCGVMDAAALAEYRTVAAEVGVDPADMPIEEFRIFLAQHDIPTFNLAEVVSYMDGIAAKDNPSGLGWHWCPVRARDTAAVMAFGRASRRGSERYRDGATTHEREINIPASDYYESHQFERWNRNQNRGWIGDLQRAASAASHTTVHVESNVRLTQAAHVEAHREPPRPGDWRQHASPAYTRTLPLHALKKIALIEREFGAGKAAFLVTDYTIEPHVLINPDPFLMAVIPNNAVSHGKGRFIIDVWDEPGFGIARMVK